MPVNTQFRRLNPRLIVGHAGGVGFLRPVWLLIAGRSEFRDAGGGRSATNILAHIIGTIREMVPRVIWGVHPMAGARVSISILVCRDAENKNRPAPFHDQH